MTRAEILKTLEEIFVDLLDDEDFSLTEDASTETVSDWDSLLHITLMASVESEFGIYVSTEDIARAKDVKTLIDIIQELA